MKVPVGHQPTIELRNHPDSPAKQLAKDHARLERCSRITVEPERDLPPIRFSRSICQESMACRVRSATATANPAAFEISPTM
jgi:hypothetical protein